MSFLPPATRKDLIRETVQLVAGIIAYIAMLAVAVWLTNGMVIEIH